MTLNAGVPVLTITTEATIGTGAQVQANDTVDVAASEALRVIGVAGNISGGGDAAVGAAGVCPDRHQDDEGMDRQRRHRQRARQRGAADDQRRQPHRRPPWTRGSIRRCRADLGGNTINLGYVDGFTENEAVRYDNGGGANIVCGSCAGGELFGGDTTASSGATLGSTYIRAHRIPDVDSADAAPGRADPDGAGRTDVLPAREPQPSAGARPAAQRRAAANRSGSSVPTR